MPFRMRSLRNIALICTMCALPFAGARAQQTDPVVDLIRRVLTDVNDLNYPRAILGGNAILSAGSVLQPQQEVALRLALAVAFYPESEGRHSGRAETTRFGAELPSLADRSRVFLFSSSELLGSHGTSAATTFFGADAVLCGGAPGDRRSYHDGLDWSQLRVLKVTATPV